MPSSNSVLPVAWITAPATDARQKKRLKTVRCSIKNVLGAQMACPIFEYFHNHPVDQRILKIEQDLTLFEARCSDLARLKAWSKPLKVRP